MIIILNGGDDMLTMDQINELETILKEKKKNNQSVRIADVTRVLYPIEIKTIDQKPETVTK